MAILLFTEPIKSAFMNLPHTTRIDRSDESLAHQMGGIKRRKDVGSRKVFRHAEVVEAQYWIMVVGGKKKGRRRASLRENSDN
jgi:hypothetical protein